MSGLVLCLVLHVILATLVRCDVQLKQIPSHPKDSSTTFLRLTASREDEGLWVARFGEYEISIELKRHPKSAWRNTAEDTWTLKLKHTSRRSEAKWNYYDEAYYNNELPSERKSSTKSDRSRQTITDRIVNDAEEIDVPIFSKLRRSGKAKKLMSEQQLPPKSQIRKKTTTLKENKVTQPFAHEPPILRALFWGNGRLPYAFNSINNETRQVENSDQTFLEADATPWGHVAAIMFDSTEQNKTTTVENKPDQWVHQEDKNPTGSIINYEHYKLTEPYALPLQQPEDGNRAERDKGENPLDDTNKHKTTHEYNYNSDTWKGSENLDNDGYGERMFRFTTGRTDVADTSDKQLPTDTLSDYVIEDNTPRDYDTGSVGSEEEVVKHGITDERQDEHYITDERQEEHGITDERQDEYGITDERQDKHGITDDRQDEHGITDERQDVHGNMDERQEEHGNTDEGRDEHGIMNVRQNEHGNTDERLDEHGITDERQDDFEPTAEMKRIMNWFPRSRLLTTVNNGYKLFPGVGWFKLITWPERWSNARRSCELEEAHLAIPDTRQKVRVLSQILKNYPDVLAQAILHRQVYVGVYSSGHDRNFSTVLGKPFVPEFPIWFPNEPDNADPGEECVTFHAEGKLRDVPCFYNLPFLCEKHLDLP